MQCDILTFLLSTSLPKDVRTGLGRLLALPASRVKKFISFLAIVSSSKERTEWTKTQSAFKLNATSLFYGARMLS